ncbi:MAG: hypothetical protein ACFFCC_16785, partial [Promethearchaeota archaeon]
RELGLIEALALYLNGWTEIAVALGIPRSYTPQGNLRRISEPIRNYVLKRWGSAYGKFEDFVRYLKRYVLEGRNQ